MSRIQPAQNPAPEAQTKLDAVKKAKGAVPNVFQTFAHSPAVLNFALQGFETLGGTSIDAGLCESIALTVSGLNGCDYCASAHTKIGEGAGLSAGEMEKNLHAGSDDAKTKAALDFVVKLVKNQAHVADTDVQMVKDAGYNDGEILEIIMVTAFTIFTNYANNVAKTDVDFPLVSTADVKKAA